MPLWSCPVPPAGAQAVVYGLPGATKPILRGISFQIEAGEALGIVGPSGAGKSTLARLLIGVTSPNAGVVRLDRADVSIWPRHLLGRHMGYLEQVLRQRIAQYEQQISGVEAQRGPLQEQLEFRRSNFIPGCQPP